VRRADIDGLRALAILPVLFFHLKMPFTHGGFLGVDAFFVISGYLIAQIVEADLAAGVFSLRRFYERRARRIFPALFAMAATTAVVGAFVMLPQEFVSLGRSIVAMTLFGSNFFFFSKANYFSAGSDFEPLLHTWSLAVEEQFYLVFPLLLVVIRRWRCGAKIALLAAFAAGSLALNWTLVAASPSAAFYLPAPRAWELLLGALLAFESLPAPDGRLIREALGLFGLGVIVFAVIFLSDRTAPSVPIAVYPCLGAASLLLAGRSSGSLVSRVLASAAPAYCGRISYSLYIWHWPLIILFKLTVGEPSSAGERLFLIAASFALAALSAQFIEKPFRRPPAAATAHAGALSWAGVAMAASLALGLAIVGVDGLPARFPEPVVAMAAHTRYGEIASMRTGTCFLSSDSNDIEFFSIERCLTLDPSRKNVLLIGDSHAAHLWSGLTEAYPDINFLQATASGCPPSLDPGPSGSACARLMRFALGDFLPRVNLDGVIVAARWADRPDGRAAELQATLDTIHRSQRDVFVIGPTVEYAMPLPRILAIGLLRRDTALPKRMREPDAFVLEPRLRETALAAGAHYVSMIATLCRDDECRTLDDDGAPLAFDYGHLTREGSRFVARRWANEGLFGVKTAGAGALASP
jgi:peptidoglycan/LPS O-acetylase OafA/YrhL